MSRVNLKKVSQVVLHLDGSFQVQQPEQINVKKEFRSIQAQKLSMPQEIPHNRYEGQIKGRKMVQDIRIQYTKEKQELSYNNFFGSSQKLPRTQKMNILKESQNNPQSNEEEDSNKKLTQIVQKQIKQRKQLQDRQLMKNNSELLDISQQNQSLNRMSSRNILKKINQERFQAKNIERNMFQGVDNDNIDYIRASTINQDIEPGENPLKDRKHKRSQLRPLKKKPSTVQVMNSLQFLKDLKKQTVEKNLQPQRQKQKTQISLQKSKVTALDIGYLKSFVCSPLNEWKFVEGKVFRDKSGFNTFFPQYTIKLDDNTFILSGQKTMLGYEMSTKAGVYDYDSDSYLGYVKGNLAGSIYNVYEGNSDTEIIATICYNSQFCSNSITRDCEIYIKDQNCKYENLDGISKNNTGINLCDLYREGQNMVDKKIKKCVSKKPIYIESIKSYKLDFGGKVTIPSVKNVILIDLECPEKKLLVFGKTDSDEFYLKFAHPLSAIIVMGFLLSSFNFKFISQ